MKEKPIMAQRIRDLRKERGLTQAQLAEKIHLKETAIRSYENGLREPTCRAMVAMEDYFGVTGKYLCGDTDEQSPRLNAKNSSIPAETEEFFVNFTDREADLFTEFLDSRGIGENDDLTREQEDVLRAVVLILNATFPPVQSSTGILDADDFSAGA